MFASDLVRALNRKAVDQRVAALRPSDNPKVDFECPFDAPESRRRLPGVGLNVGALGLLRRLSKTWDPDLVQMHGGDALKAGVMAGLGRHAATVYRRIGSAPGWIRRGPRRGIYAALFKRADHVIAVAERTRLETIEVFGVPPTRVTTIPNGVDLARLSPIAGDAARRELGIPLEAKVILSLGALTWEKDPLEHVRVSKLVQQRVPRVLHLMVGSGPLKGDVDEEIESLNLSSHVRTMAPRGDVATLFCASDVLLVASVVEGAPAAIIEAGCLAVPAVGYSVGGVPDVIEDGRTGLLAEAGQTRVLAERAATLLTDARLRQALGAAASDSYRSRFDIDDVADRYLGLYERLVAR